MYRIFWAIYNVNFFSVTLISFTDFLHESIPVDEIQIYLILGLFQILEDEDVTPRSTSPILSASPGLFSPRNQPKQDASFFHAYHLFNGHIPFH